MLGTLAEALVERDDALQAVILNKDTPDEALAAIAAQVSGAMAEILAGNQERCMRSEALVRALCGNTEVLRSSLDRLFDFLVRSGIIYGRPAADGRCPGPTVAIADAGSR